MTVNVFILSKDPVEAAKYHCDKHVVKMPTEAAQMLFTAARLLGYPCKDGYKSTHERHPHLIGGTLVYFCKQLGKMFDRPLACFSGAYRPF